MSTLVECVPNFSEGRDKAKVDAIVDAMKMPGVYLLDREIDSDHNRCVITLVGEREAIQEAAIRGVGKAAELIDLNVHTGAHPRMGATDVVPFIPIEGVTIEDCVAMANHVGDGDLEALSDSGLSLRSRRRELPNARAWRIFAAASSKASAPRSPPIPRAVRTSASRACIRRRARRSSARANS